MKTKELRESSKQELVKRAGELRRELLGLRIKKANQQLKNSLQLRSVRREIATILTIIKEKGEQ